jgi:hypothetical protein
MKKSKINTGAAPSNVVARFSDTDTYTACSIVEGFSGGEHTPQEHIAAWALLIRTGTAWTLQGWYGRNAQAMIDSGLINPQGEVDWQEVEDRLTDEP